MDLILKYLDGVYGRLQQEFDRIVIVLGDEGMGKSSFMMQAAWFWQETVDAMDDPTVESTMGKVAWDMAEFKEAMTTKPPYDAIVVHDAARVLHKRKAMHPDEIELEEDLLDVRQGQFLIMLGFQDWDVVPSMLQNRRAHNVVRIPSRGRVHIYNREQIDKRNEKGKWPDPALVDNFESLEGTELWRTFKEEDLRRKRERIEPEAEEHEMSVAELADQILDDGVEKVTSIHGAHRRPYIDSDLIEVEYGTSGRKAKKVAKLLKKKDEAQLD